MIRNIIIYLWRILVCQVDHYLHKLGIADNHDRTLADYLLDAQFHGFGETAEELDYASVEICGSDMADMGLDTPPYFPFLRCLNFLSTVRAFVHVQEQDVDVLASKLALHWIT